MAIKYGYDKKGDRHFWFAKGDMGAAHIWAVQHDPKRAASYGEKYWGGIECHSPKPIYEHSEESKPHHDNCWLLEGPCWHDGSSLQFSDEIEPMLRDCECVREMDEYLFGILRDRYHAWFCRTEEDA